jgi:hypothetical protein
LMKILIFKESNKEQDRHREEMTTSLYPVTHQ